jgi:phosphotransferase system HPr-like phosphotransfer protein
MIQLRVDGEDERAASDAIADLFARKFDEAS